MNPGDSDVRPRLVLLPGLDGTGDLFAPFLRVWKQRPSPLVIGYPRDRFLDFDEACDHVAAQLPPAGKIILLAESFSGPVGVMLAARHPDCVAALILCATFVTPPRTAPLRQLLRFLAPLIFHIPSPAFAIRELLLNGHRDVELLALVRANKCRVAPRVMARRLQQVMMFDAREALRRVRCPLFYLQAARDRLVPDASAAEIKAIQPAAEIIRIDGPHFLMQSQPVEVAAALDRVLAQTGHVM